MLNRWNFWFKPDSMRWFSHRRRTGGRKAPEDRSRKSLSTCTAVILSPPAATQWYSLLLHAAYGAWRTPYYVLSMGMTQQFFVLGDLDLLLLTPKFEFAQSFVILRLIARKLCCGRTDKLTNKQTPLKTSTSLRYATPVGDGLTNIRWTLQLLKHGSLTLPHRATVSGETTKHQQTPCHVTNIVSRMTRSPAADRPRHSDHNF